MRENNTTILQHGSPNCHTGVDIVGHFLSTTTLQHKVKRDGASSGDDEGTATILQCVWCGHFTNDSV